MRKLLIPSMLLLAAAAAFAQMPGSSPADLKDEITAILEQNAATQIGSITIGDMEGIVGQISIAVQKAQYVQRARAASFMLPGMGQFMAGDALGGSLFLAGDLGVMAGTLLGWYFLLPANVQFGSLDYLNTQISTIKNIWQSNTVMQYLPSMGVMAGGMIVQGLLRWFSGTNAAAQARANIASGKVTFQPQIMPNMGMGMMFDLKY
jgi:TM2 domain-containing membrane protein YozV